MDDATPCPLCDEYPCTCGQPSQVRGYKFRYATLEVSGPCKILIRPNTDRPIVIHAAPGHKSRQVE